MTTLNCKRIKKRNIKEFNQGNLIKWQRININTKACLINNVNIKELF